MKIILNLDWGKLPKFKHKAYQQMLDEYLARINHYTKIELKTFDATNIQGSDVLWLCEGSHRIEQQMTSRQISEALSKLQDSGIKNLHIAIGGPSGWTADQKRLLNVNKQWSFGTLTLPHELAAVIAVEQVYRAFTILRGEPYHLAHE